MFEYLKARSRCSEHGVNERDELWKRVLNIWIVVVFTYLRGRVVICWNSAGHVKQLPNRYVAPRRILR